MNNSLKSMELNRSVYFVLSSTSTRIGGIIRVVTQNRYNHMSVAFNRDLTEMYSYARRNASSPFVGGFVRETPLRFTFNQQNDTLIKICELPLTEDKYIRIREYIEYLKRHQNECFYNLFAAALYPLHKGIEIKDSYSCVGFAAQLLMLAGIADTNKKCYQYTIQELEEKLDGYKVFEGMLSEYEHSSEWFDDLFFERQHFYTVTLSSIKYLLKLLYKAIIRNH